MVVDVAPTLPAVVVLAQAPCAVVSRMAADKDRQDQVVYSALRLPAPVPALAMAR